MLKKRLVLTFPQAVVEEPITYRLIKDYDLVVNILRARISREEEGRLIIEISGEKEALDKGLAYLKKIGVAVQPLAKDVRWLEDRCTHCTVCVPLCSTEAIVVDRERMEISFDKDRCIVCGACIPACPYKAVEILF